MKIIKTGIAFGMFLKFLRLSIAFQAFFILSMIALSGCSNSNPGKGGARKPVSLQITAASLGGNRPSTLTFKVGTEPTAIAIDASGNIWVVNGGSADITKLNQKGALIGTYPVPSIAGFKSLSGVIAIDAPGNIWLIDNGKLVGMNQAGVARIYGTSLKSPIVATGAGMAIDGSGNIWTAGPGGVIEASPEGVLVSGISGYPAGRNITHIAVESSGDVLATNDLFNTVTELSAQGGIIGKYKAGAPLIGSPSSIAVDKSGDIWLGGGLRNVVAKLSPAGAVIGTYKTGDSPRAIAIDASGNVWVVNEAGNNVTELNSSGTLIRTYPAGHNPDAIAIDASGNVWVADGGLDDVTELIGAAKGPEYFPYRGPQWP